MLPPLLKWFGGVHCMDNFCKALAVLFMGDADGQ